MHEKYMKMAIAKAQEGIVCGQTPFGACIVKDGEVLSCEHNAVWKDMDITAHAEIQAIRSACRKKGNIDLTGSVIYSTCEPCPMCFSACHWANISQIVYGAEIHDAKKAGFHELTISNQQMKHEGGSSLDLIPGVLKNDCQELFRLWKNAQDSRSY